MKSYLGSRRANPYIVLVQREMESRRSLLASIEPFRGPSLRTPPNVVAGQASLLNLQLISKEIKLAGAPDSCLLTPQNQTGQERNQSPVDSRSLRRRADSLVNASRQGRTCGHIWARH